MHRRSPPLHQYSHTTSRHRCDEAQDYRLWPTLANCRRPPSRTFETNVPRPQHPTPNIREVFALSRDTHTSVQALSSTATQHSRLTDTHNRACPAKKQQTTATPKKSRRQHTYTNPSCSSHLLHKREKSVLSDHPKISQQWQSNGIGCSCVCAQFGFSAIVRFSPPQRRADFPARRFSPSISPPCSVPRSRSGVEMTEENESVRSHKHTLVRTLLALGDTRASASSISWSTARVASGPRPRAGCV